jgi:hypothetical protein
MRHFLGIGLVILGLAPPPSGAAAQVPTASEALEEIRSISVRAELIGGSLPDAGRITRLLDDVLRQELDRADILFERGEPRAGDCCLLRLEVRLAQGSGRSRFGTGYTARLELGYLDRLGNIPTWTIIWTGRMVGNIVERSELADNLRFSARELAGDFIDLYRERFPRR